METALIIIDEYCKNSNIESSFITLLADEGLIDIQIIEDKTYIYESQLAELDRFANLYYDLSVNIEGIDIIHNLLSKIQGMEKELYALRKVIDSQKELWNDID